MSKSHVFVLGIESSCDETAAAVVDGEGNVLSDVVFSQVEMHNKYGGIVPELASRDHALKIEAVVSEAIQKSGVPVDKITHVGTACGPGLLGCLLVGISFGKAFAMARNIPFIGVDHIKSHILAVTLNDVKSAHKEVQFPFIGMVVSGGHTSIYLVKSPSDIEAVASTVDDAAGEIFDKIARFIGLGYPGGKIISDIAKTGKAGTVKFTKPSVKGREHDFSFSGLKTAAINYFRKIEVRDGKFEFNSEEIKNILASFQETICEILVEKLLKAAKEYKVKDIVIGGGVAANYRLREVFTERAKAEGFNALLVPVKYCTDNATMIANNARLIAETLESKGFTPEMSKTQAYSTTRK